MSSRLRPQETLTSQILDEAQECLWLRGRVGATALGRSAHFALHNLLPVWFWIYLQSTFTLMAFTEFETTRLWRTGNTLSHLKIITSLYSAASFCYIHDGLGLQASTTTTQRSILPERFVAEVIHSTPHRLADDSGQRVVQVMVHSEARAQPESSRVHLLRMSLTPPCVSVDFSLIYSSH